MLKRILVVLVIGGLFAVSIAELTTAEAPRAAARCTSTDPSAPGAPCAQAGPPRCQNDARHIHAPARTC